jgi:tRNA nucleotidyltransferase/poly(A) polymerase
MKDLSVQTEGLSGERIYIEVDKTFKSSNSPSIFFNVLKETENLDIWFPVISHLVGLTHIHYLDVYDHVMNVVDITKMSTDSIPALWGALYHDIGKIFTNDSQLPYHCDHDRTGLFLVPYISKRLKLPNNIKKTIEDTIKFHLTINEIYKMKPVQILKIIHHLQKRKTLSDVLSVVNSIKVSKGLSGIDGIIIKHIKNAEIVNMLNVPNHISDLFNGKNGIEISNRVLNWRVEEFNKRISLTDYI